MGIKVESAAYSSIGGRKNNEDNFYLDGIFLPREQMDQGGKIAAMNTQPIQMYAVFDGMGGGDYGEYASFYSASRLHEYQKESDHADHSENIRRFLTDTSKGIDKIAEEQGLSSGACGSTVAMLIIGDWWYRTAPVGDSRVYLLRGQELTRLTKDQSLVQRMVDAGKITLEEAWAHPKKNIITHHLGMPLRTEEIQSVIGERMPLQVGDCFLICSDGVSDSLRDQEIQELIDVDESAENIASRVVRHAKRSADHMGVESDNITAVVLKIQQVAGSDDAVKRVKRMAFRQKLMAGFTVLCGLGAVAALVMMLLA